MIYLVPQYPVKNRYPGQWIRWWPRELKLSGLEVEVLGEEVEGGCFKYGGVNKFTDTLATVSFELDQMKSLFGKVSKGDVVLFLDLDFPGFASDAVALLRRMYGDSIGIYGFVHATSVNEGDFWEPIRRWKRLIEEAVFGLVDVVFVATEYHRSKLEKEFSSIAGKVKVVGCPFFRDEVCNGGWKSWKERVWDVFVPARPDEQKFRKISMLEGVKLKFAEEELESREYYFKTLSESKICLSLASEETFGYAVVEAMAFGTVTVVPDRFSYPEVVPVAELRYKDEEEMRRCVMRLLENEEEWRRAGLFLYSSLLRWEYSIRKVAEVLFSGGKCG